MKIHNLEIINQEAILKTNMVEPAWAVKKTAYLQLGSKSQLGGGAAKLGWVWVGVQVYILLTNMNQMKSNLASVM